MSKRKVNDIVYEIDDNDLEPSSEEEGTNDLKRLKSNEPLENNPAVVETNSNESMTPVESEVIPNTTPVNTPIKQNGIQATEVPSITDEDAVDTNSSETTNPEMLTNGDDDNGTIIVAGCEPKTPLVSVTFKNKNLASNYKQKIKEFMINLIKVHEAGENDGSGIDSDLELDIWPEDCIISEDNELLSEQNSIEEENNLFFIDTDPVKNETVDVPHYQKITSILSDVQAPEQTSPAPQRRPLTCFNCDGEHSLRDCKLPRNNARISEMRKAKSMNKVGRYHVEDEQKYGHLVPGRISGKLRHALGLQRNEQPLYIYMMRLLGYPPGWLEEARISHSGISMFDSLGQEIQDPEDEEGEFVEPGSKDKFDIKKIIDFPGFNVKSSSRYLEEAHRYGLPPMSEEDSKLNMLQVLAPNAMKAYKRKKLSIFPSALNSSVQGQAEMELDEGDELAEFPSVPPLPDEAPPLPPPPPEAPPPPPEVPPPPPEVPPTPAPPPPLESSASPLQDNTQIEQVNEISEKDPDLVVESNSKIEETKERSISPSLADLEEKKRLLLNALEGSPMTSQNEDSNIEGDSINMDSPQIGDIPEDHNPQVDLPEESPVEDTDLTKKVSDQKTVDIKVDSIQNSPKIKMVNSPKTPQGKFTGHVKSSSFGTPVMNTASPYVKLPSDDKFAKDITDVINFENLPDSTGKYKKICSLLKRVKNEVDRIQDS